MHSDYLYTLSEIAIAIAGFAGIVVAVLGTAERTLERRALDLTLLKNVLASAFMATGFSLLPLTLIEMEVEARLAWQISSFTAAAVFSLYFVAHLPGTLKSYRAVGGSLPWTYILNIVLATAVIGVLLFSAIGKVDYSMYLTAPAYMVYAACFSFARVFYSITPE